MIKRICFFTVGYAHNRLVRLRYYEKIFPKNVKIYLYTTDKYESKKEGLKNWNDLKRTKIEIAKYHSIKSAFNLRKFCQKNKIERLVNLGAPGAGIPFIIATLLTKRDYLMGYYGEVVKHKRAKNLPNAIKKFFLLFQYLFVGRFAKKLTFTDITSYKKAPIFFMSSKERINYSHAPVDTHLFVQSSKEIARKKLKLSANKKIILRVGRINYGKCGDLLLKLAEGNPNMYFILIGEWFENEVGNKNLPNVNHIVKKSSKELVDYYNASDLVFCLHRHGDGIGITAEEALACGIPVILPNTLTMKDSPAILKTSFSVEEINKKIRKFFSQPKKEREQLSKEARRYAEKYCSDNVWKNEYTKFHLT